MHTYNPLSSVEEKMRMPLSSLDKLRRGGGTPQPTQAPPDTGRRLGNTNIVPIQRTPENPQEEKDSLPGFEEAPMLDRSPLEVLPNFQRLSLLPQYRDEEKKIGWRASSSEESKQKLNSDDPLVREKQEKIRDSSETVTNYLGPEERKQFAVQSNGQGLLENNQNQPVDTNKGRGGFSGTAGTHIFALGLDGGLHMGDAIANNDMAFNKHVNTGPVQERNKRTEEAREKGLQNKTFHHSSFYAGGDIAGAGELGVDNGRVRFIGDGSGHYRPGGDIMHQTVSHMGMSKDDGGLGLSLMDPNNKEARVGLMGKKEGEEAVKMPVSSYLQTGGNEGQIRNKIGLQDELKGLTGPQMEFNPTPGSDRRKDGLSPTDNVFDYDKIDDPSENSHVDSNSTLSPSRIKAKITDDKRWAAKHAEGDEEAMKENAESRPAFLRKLDEKAGRRNQPLLTGGNYLSPTNYGGKTDYLPGTEDDSSPMPTMTEETKTNYGGGVTNYALTNYGGSNDTVIENNVIESNVTPTVKEEAQETKEEETSETNYGGGASNYTLTNYGG